MLELKEKKCVPCKEGTPPMGNAEIAKLKTQLVTPWQLADNKKLTKEFNFADFKRAIAFVQEIALIAEEEQHHPDICISYTKVNIELTTHSVGGLSENDFIMAAKIEHL